MAVLSKSQMSEEDIKFHYITPAITAKWNNQHITLETKITDGRINLKGNIVAREKPKRADYVLYLSANRSRCPSLMCSTLICTSSLTRAPVAAKKRMTKYQSILPSRFKQFLK